MDESPAGGWIFIFCDSLVRDRACKGCETIMWTFFGLNIGLNALETAQQAESVIANNISNSSTPGYTRETANIVEQVPYPPLPSYQAPILAGQFGQGSEVAAVLREVNRGIDQQVRTNLSFFYAQQALYTGLSQLQDITGEPSTTGIQAALDSFFSSWATLATDPQDMAARATVLQQAKNFADTLSGIQSQLAQWIDNMENVIGTGSNPNSDNQIAQVNQYAQELAQLNQQIAQVTAFGQNPNQLLDKQGQILNQLAQLGSTFVTTYQNGTVDVRFGGTSSSGGIQIVTSGGTWNTFSSSDISLLQAGSIYGNQQALSQAQALLQNIGYLGQAVANAVNNQLAKGWQYNSSNPNPDGVPIFDVSANQLTDGTQYSTVQAASLTPDEIAAAQNPGAPGDGANANQIAQLQNDAAPFTYATVGGAPSSLGGTPDQFYASLVASLGGQVSEAQNQQQLADSLLQQSQNQQQAVEGVNINEETTRMIEFQNMFNAASKFIEVLNNMLQTLIAEV